MLTESVKRAKEIRTGGTALGYLCGNTNQCLAVVDELAAWIDCFNREWL